MAGGLINIDVSAELSGFFDDTGASFAVPPVSARVERLCGSALHEHPTEIPTWNQSSERRKITEGLVFTLEPFLSLGADWVEATGDGWTLRPLGGEPAVQYEHTLVATRNGPVVVTLAQ